MAKAVEIAEWVGSDLAPGADIEAKLLGVSSIEAAGAASIVFATDKKTLAQAVGSSAGLILASLSLADANATDPRILRVADARLAFAQVAKRLAAVERTTEIHPSAVVHETVKVGDGTRIGAGCVLGEGVAVGVDCEIGPRVTIYAGTRLGDRVNVQAGAVLGGQGFGYARDAAGEYILFPQQGTLVIEDDVDIGANTTIDRGALGETRIGAGSKLDNLVHIGHNCVIGRSVVIAAQTGISGSSVVEDGAILGGQVGIGEHALVGKGVILGGGAGVLSNKKMQGPGQVFWGRPARPLKEYLKDLASLKRR